MQCLTVKIVIPDNLKHKLKIFVTNKYLKGSYGNNMKKKFMDQVIDQTINKKRNQKKKSLKSK